MKGIILAGGAGTRLYPLTTVATKQLLPVYDKPMIYYPLSTLMLAGIKDIMIISTPQDINSFKNLLGSGNQFGINLKYAIQEKPEGIAQAFLIAEDFIGEDNCALILGDNMYYGSGLSELLQIGVQNAKEGFATIFGYYVNDPERFGIMEFDDDWNVISVEEKPKKPKSNYCITGLYFYDNRAVEFAKKVKPSERGELEITSLNDIYLKSQALRCQILGRGYAWQDMGTVDSLLEAANFVEIIEKRQGVMLASLEEVAFRKGWIRKEELLNVATKYGNTEYGRYLNLVAEGKVKY